MTELTSQSFPNGPRCDHGTEAQYRASRGDVTMLDVIRRGAAPKTLKLIDCATGEEIPLPAKRKCWDGYEITITKLQLNPERGNEELIYTANNEVYVPSVCGAKIIEFPLTEEDVNFAGSRL